MALNATIFKAGLTVTDMDRGYYADHALVLARHPSETDERLMARLLAFALNADEALAFGKGLSSDNEPDLWRKDPTGAISSWIMVGLPDDKTVRKACGRAERVRLYAYGRNAEHWWQGIQGALTRPANLTVYNLPSVATVELAKLAQRTMQLQCTIQDGTAWLTDGPRTVEIHPTILKDVREA